MSVTTTYTIRETAALLHVSEDTIRRRLAEFQAIRIGRTYRITVAGIEHFIRINRVAPPTVRQIRPRLAGPERLRQARALREKAARS